MRTSSFAAATVVSLVLTLPASAGALSISQLDDAGSCVASGAAPAGCTAAGALADPAAMAIPPDGRSAYVAASGLDPESLGARTQGGGLAVLRRDPDTGRLTPAGCLSDGGTDGLTPAACTPAAGLQSAGAVVVTPDGANVYVLGSTATGVAGEMEVGVHTGPPEIYAYARDATTGALNALSGSQACVSARGGACTTFAATGAPQASPDGAFLYTAAGKRIGILARGTGGALRPVASRVKARGLGQVQGLAFSPDGRFVWASVYADRSDGQYGGFGLLTFTRNPGTGALRQLAGSRGCTLSRAVPKRLAKGCARVASGKILGLPTLSTAGGGYARLGTGGVVQPVRAVGGVLRSAGAPVRGMYGALVVAPDGAAAYRTDGVGYGTRGFGSLTAYARDGASGALVAPSGAAGCVAEAVGDLSTAGEYASAPKSPPCAPGHALGGSSDALPSPDGRFVYVRSSLSTTLPGAITTFAVGP